MNKVVQTKASRETPPSDGLAGDQEDSQKNEASTTDAAGETASKRDPVEEVQNEVHPFN